MKAKRKKKRTRGLIPKVPGSPPGIFATSPRQQLELAYTRMSTLTQPKCGAACGRPGFCCKPEFCEMTAKNAREVYGVQLARTKHKTLPMMGEYGCTVPPYLRPICTIYVCEKHLEEDPIFAAYYRQQRDVIEELELKIETQGQTTRRDHGEPASSLRT